MVEYNEKEKSLQISVHLFIDDLEESLKKRGILNYLYAQRENPRRLKNTLNRTLERIFLSL